MNFSIATYNLQGGGAERLDAFQVVLQHVNADVVTLTEADHQEVVQKLADRLQMHSVWAQGSGDRHTATLSRFPVVRWQIYNRPPLTQAALETELDTPWGPLAVYGVHFLPYLLLPFEVRRWQAVGRLLQIVRASDCECQVIAGDLNAIGPGDRVLQQHNPPRMRRVMALQLFLIFRLAIPRLLRAGFVDCYRQLNPGVDGFTWMPGNPTTRYDYIMASRQLAPALRACRVVDDAPLLDIASDHFPLVARFQPDDRL